MYSFISILHASSFLEDESFEYVNYKNLPLPFMWDRVNSSILDNGGTGNSYLCVDKIKCFSCKYFKMLFFLMSYFSHSSIYDSKLPSTYKSEIFSTPLLNHILNPPSALPGIKQLLPHTGENCDNAGVSPTCWCAECHTEMVFLRKGFFVC